MNDLGYRVFLFLCLLNCLSLSKADLVRPLPLPCFCLDGTGFCRQSFSFLRIFFSFISPSMTGFSAVFPAVVENSSSSYAGSPPRTRGIVGANQSLPSGQLLACLPPRTRGIVGTLSAYTYSRFTPAYAGNRPCSWGPACRTGVHPRVRGE